MKGILIFNIIVIIVSVGCNAIKETSSHQMETGIYKVSTEKNKRYYAIVEEDKIMLHPAVKTKEGWVANKDSTSAIFFKLNQAYKSSVTFNTQSLDVDVLTLLFKYRPYTAGFPNQLNTNFNGAGYFGLRSDYYLLSYYKTPLQTFERKINHFACSIGFFAGVGSTNMNPFVTNTQVQAEYDGVVITKGLTALIGVGNLTFGASLGLDHLMDKNNKVWIYQGKPFAGFIIGLNIN